MANKKYEKISIEEAVKVHAAKPNLELLVKKVEMVAAETTPIKLLQDDAEWPNLSQILLLEPKADEEFNWQEMANDFNARVKANTAPGKNLKALTAGECRKGARQHCQRQSAEADQALKLNPSDSAAQAKKNEILRIVSLRGWTEIARGWTADDDDAKSKTRSNKATKAKDKATNHRAVIAGSDSAGKTDHKVTGNITADAGLATATPTEVPPAVGPGKPEDKPARAPAKPLNPEPIKLPGKDEDGALVVPGPREYLAWKEPATCPPYRNTGPKPEGMVFVEGFAKPFSEYINANDGGFSSKDRKAWIKPELAELLQRSIHKHDEERPKARR